jgi:hypothetical protein
MPARSHVLDLVRHDAIQIEWAHCRRGAPDGVRRCRQGVVRGS